MSVRRRIWVWIGLVALGGGAVAVIVTRLHAVRDEGAFQEQLRLARLEGIPVTAKEYAASIPTASPDENAAPLYRQLKGKTRTSDDVGKLTTELIFHPDEATRSKARLLLASLEPVFSIADQAAKKPKCWFDRDWSKGAAVLMPEFADMVGVSKLLALRGAVAADRGDVASALDNARELFVLSRHAGQEKSAISHLISERLYLIGLQCLMNWSYVHRNQATYAEELQKSIPGFPKPNLKEEMRGELLEILSTIDLCSTPEGRRELGLREEDVGAAEKILPVLLSQPKARIKIVQAERAYFAALDKPLAERGTYVEAARTERNSALLAFPTAADIYLNLTSGSSTDSGDDVAMFREPMWEGRRQQLVAIARALRSNPIPKRIDTSDLRSPFDGKPLDYRFDGNQIVVHISSPAGDAMADRKLPSDDALGRKPKPRKP